MNKAHASYCRIPGYTARSLFTPGPVWIFLVLAMALPVNTARAQTRPDKTYVQVSTADFALQASGDSPPAVGWEKISLPHRWDEKQSWKHSRIGWYRIDLDQILKRIQADQNPHLPIAVYLQRLSTNARVYINDEFVGSGGSFEEPVSRNMHRPLYFLIPRSSIEKEHNELYIELKVYPTFAHLVGVRVGYDFALRRTFQRQYLFQVTLSRLLFSVALVCSLLGFLFWYFIERQPLALFFSLTALSWSIYCLNLTIRDIPVSARIWWSMIHVNLEWAAVFFVFFTYRLCRVHKPIFERVLIGYAVAATLIYGFAGIEHIKLVSQIIHSITLVLVIYIGSWLLWRFYRTRSPESGLLALCMVCLTLLGANDLLRHTEPVTSPHWQTRFYLMQFGAPLMFVILAVFVGTRYAKATKRARELRLAEQEIRQQERQRIYQDLHDDLGAKLLGLVYTAQSEEQARLARSALSDIREIVSGTPLESNTLSGMIEHLFTEMRYRASKGGVKTEFSENSDDGTIISGEVIYHLSRIFRELLSNTLKHANASVVSVSITRANDHLVIRYVDDGAGLPEKAKRGTGMLSIERRIRMLNANLAIEKGKKGFSCTLSVPIPIEQPPANE